MSNIPPLNLFLACKEYKEARLSSFEDVCRTDNTFRDPGGTFLGGEATKKKKKTTVE